MKRIAFCADDFGDGPAVDRGILQLVEAGRLTAVSCQVGGRGWAADAPALLAGAGDADLGLHLELAPGRGGLLALIAASHLRTLDRAALAGRVAAQLDAFERSAGRPPAFVDGHQHCHQLPVVRDVLLEALEARYPGGVPLVRSTRPARWRGGKAAVIAALGGTALDRELARRGIPHNRDFGGVYGLTPEADYRALVQGWLADLADGGLVLCHPGAAPGDPGDPIAPARAAELAYLGSGAFTEDLGTAGVTLVPPRALGRGAEGAAVTPPER